MNKVFLIGNLTRDPELTETASGVPVCHFAIAVNRNYSSQDGERQTDFFNCTAWRTTAETIARYTKKGKKVAVTGSIQMRNYEDKQGVKRTAVDIIVQDVEFLSPKDNETLDEVPTRSAKTKPSLQAMDGDDDIPF
jgi:single-strand DNA-binding protein